MRKKVRSAAPLSRVFSSPCPHTGQTGAQGFTVTLGSSGVRVQPWVVARQPGILSDRDPRAPPRARPVDVGRRVAGAGGRRRDRGASGSRARALSGGACSPQRGAAQVSGRRGRGDAGRWVDGPCRVSPFPGTPAPLPRPFQSGVQHSPKAATFLWHRCQRGAVSPAGLHSSSRAT